MTRTSQLLHAQREPALAASRHRAAAGGDGTRPDGQPCIEVLMTRRSMAASFAPGAYVFPAAASTPLMLPPISSPRHRPQQGGPALTQAIAAIRESFEELGILLARHADGPHGRRRHRGCTGP